MDMKEAMKARHMVRKYTGIMRRNHLSAINS